jgi:N-acylneuraminate cytidylyltransferase/CMP-N,N'-diacetyllegionaminic acid synthase
VVVSTDDSEIAGIAKDHGAEAPFLRPPQIAGDDSNVIEAIVHALEWLATNDAYYPAVTVLLQPTSPFRTSHDIDAAIDLLVGKGADSVISVCVPDHSPYWMYNLDEEGRLVDFVRPVSESRRQDMPRVYFVNGAVYAARTETLLADRSFFKSERKYPYLMDTDRSLQIDTEMEFLFAEALVAKQSG